MLDQPTPQPLARYIQTIRNALWRKGAAVMVGSGFSRNAEPNSMTHRSFPTWKDLTCRLFEGLHPPGAIGMTNDDRIRATTTGGALQLAEQYQATFGRQLLENLIQDVIPDREFSPGELHLRLLRLPWEDVLTTNYDTLLERAAERVIERRYDVVRTVADVPRAKPPRIVKLHGSFPSHRPFILTAEDFRTYPRAFAGFANLAQQTASENVLCLIGFSGDDPNFLEWTGWVRDHLRADAPRIYLCGVLDADESICSLLDRRNVMLAGHELFGATIRTPGIGILKYLRGDLLETSR